MKNLKIWQKLALMGAVFMLPFAVVTYKMTSSINALGSEFARQEIRGLDYCLPLLGLLNDLQQHRAMAGIWLSGDSSVKDNLASKNADIANDIKTVSEVDRRLGSVLHIRPKWAALSAASHDLLNAPLSMSPKDSFDQHTKVIADTITLIADIGDAANLTLDPDIDSYYLISMLIFQGPELSELLGQARGLGASMAASKGGTPEQFASLNRLSTLAAFAQNKMAHSLSTVLTSNPALRAQLEMHGQDTARSVQETVDKVRGIVETGKIDTTATAYFAMMTKSLNSVFDMGGDVAKVLNGLLNQRIKKFWHEVMITLAEAVLGLLVVSGIGFFIARDITLGLRQVVGIANQVATGDLALVTITGSRKDEIGLLARGFNHMIEALSKLVSQVQQSGIQVTASINEIAAMSKEQQATANEIAATTSEIGATSKQISTTSRELVNIMHDVSIVAEQSADLAASGKKGLLRMEDTMRHITDAAEAINAKLTILNEKTGNITQVVATITKVADQTNLLSLNAAIEAEKAGEYGRGFAVVATEIRRLADQTAVATYDIGKTVKEIQAAVSGSVMGMDKFSEAVRRGTQEVEQVGGQLSEIIVQVQAQAPRFEAVNEGMQGQAASAEQISEALMQLSQAVQQTVQSLQQSSHTIAELNHVSGNLRAGVSRFTLAA